MIMLLGPVLLITGLPLRKRAMLLGSRSRVPHLAIVLIRCRSSNPGNTRAPVPRTIARKSNHRRGLRTIDHNLGRRIIVRPKLRRQDQSSQRVPRILGRIRRRDRIIALKLHRLRIGRCATIRPRRRALHSHHRNVRAVPLLRRNARTIPLLRRNAKITQPHLQRTKTKSRPRVAKLDVI
jgi:hypothetical protein